MSVDELMEALRLHLLAGRLAGTETVRLAVSVDTTGYVTGRLVDIIIHAKTIELSTD